MTSRTNLFVAFDKRRDAQMFVRDLIAHGAKGRDIVYVRHQAPATEGAHGPTHQISESAHTLARAANTLRLVGKILFIVALAGVVLGFVDRGGLWITFAGGALIAAIAAYATSAAMRVFMEAQGLSPDEFEQAMVVHGGQILVSVCVPSGEVDLEMVERLRPHPSQASLL